MTQVTVFLSFLTCKGLVLNWDLSQQNMSNSGTFPGLAEEWNGEVCQQCNSKFLILKQLS